MRNCLALLLISVCAHAANSPEIAGCPVFSERSIWNTPVDRLPVTSTSVSRIATIGASAPLHPDFSSLPIYGYPVNIISHEKGTNFFPVQFQYSDESDRVLFPIPSKPVIEGGSDSTGDRHLLIVDKTDCVLYELFYYQPPTAAGQPYTAAAGAVFDLHWDDLRPSDWTSADAAGLPIVPGLVRYDEVKAGAINHALRFTVPHSQNTYVWPARHFASQLSGMEYMPMGTRLRLKASVDISRFSRDNQVILKALKKYGMMLADNGGPWFLSGETDPRWNDSDLGQLKSLSGSDFEEVDVSPLQAAQDSGAVVQPAAVSSDAARRIVR